MNPEPPEAGAPQTVLFALIKDRLNKTPFVPFRIRTTSGEAYEVPTADHAVVFPRMRTITIVDDSDRELEVHTLHVSSIETLLPRSRPRRRRRAA